MAIAQVHVQYVSDDGNTYQRRTYADLVTPLGLTSEALGAHPRLPNNIKPRYVLARDSSTGREHKLRGVSPTNAMFVGTAATVGVPDPENRGTGTINLNVAGRVGEKRYSR